MNSSAIGTRLLCLSRAASIIVPAVLTATLLIIGCKDENIIQGPNDESNPAVQPQVIFTLPENNSVGPYDLFSNSGGISKPHFVLRFNKLMDLYSFNPQFVTVEGSDFPLRVDLFENYYPIFRGKNQRLLHPSDARYDDVVSFSISDSASYQRILYRVGRTYSITLKPGFKDINGNTTLGNYRFTYTPEPFFRTTAIYPADQRGGVSPFSSISMYFNSKITLSIAGALEILPPLDGTWKLSVYDSTVMDFKPFEYLPFGKTFTVTVRPEARDRYGNPIVHQESSTFTVTPFKVASTTPVDGSSDLDLNATLSVTFSGAVDTSSLRYAITVYPPTAIYFSPYSSSISLHAINGFDPMTMYTVAVSKMVRAYDGTPLSEPYAFSFSTGPFRVTSTYPSNGEFNVYRSATGYVYCNASIDTGSVRSSIRIDPQIALAVMTYDGETGFSFHPIQMFEAGTIYTVTVTTALRSKNGFNLPQPYSFRFRTGG